MPALGVCVMREGVGGQVAACGRRHWGRLGRWGAGACNKLGFGPVAVSVSVLWDLLSGLSRGGCCPPGFLNTLSAPLPAHCPSLLTSH